MTGGIRTELHFHLLPGVDDGPASLEEALELARLAVADGTGTVVCTPHVHMVEVASVPGRVRDLQAALDAEGIPLRLHAGGEITPGTPVTAAELEVLAHGPAGGRWVLLEAPLHGAGTEDLHDHAAELRDRGYGVLVGHPERCGALVAPGGGLDVLLRAGARLQVNASSLAGAHGLRARAAGLDLVRRGLVTAIASDAHRPDRPPRLTEALRVLGRDASEALVDGGPAALLRHGIAPVRRAA